MQWTLDLYQPDRANIENNLKNLRNVLKTDSVSSLVSTYTESQRGIIVFHEFLIVWNI